MAEIHNEADLHRDAPVRRTTVISTRTLSLIFSLPALPSFSTNCDDLCRELALCLHLFVKAFIILPFLCLAASSSFRRFLHGGLRGLPVRNDRKTALWYYS
jgi:hypothetical protein